MPLTIGVLYFYIFIAFILGLGGSVAYVMIAVETRTRFRRWMSNLHACHRWRRDYLEYYRSLETDEQILSANEPDELTEEDCDVNLDYEYFDDWRAENAAESYFEGLENLEQARQRLYGPMIFPMLIWQVLLPWGDVSGLDTA